LVYGAEQRALSNYLYLEIASTLRGRIERGDFAQGRLPSERDLTSEFGVQRATVRRALKTLEQEGMIFRDATRGTFARPRGAVRRKTEVEKAGIALVVGRAADTTAPGDIARGLAHVVRADDRFLVWFDTPAAPGHAEVEVPDPADLVARGVAACALWPQIPASVERLRALRDALALGLLVRRVPGV
jgi:DNA-binding transcriptional regulator YhcF (GntR family)